MKRLLDILLVGSDKYQDAVDKDTVIQLISLKLPNALKDHCF